MAFSWRGAASSPHPHDPSVPVDGVLVELAELPVDREDVHVVVLLEVVGEQVQGVIAGLKPLLILIDFLHLKGRTEEFTSASCWKRQTCDNKEPKSFFLFYHVCRFTTYFLRLRLNPQTIRPHFKALKAQMCLKTLV